MAVIYSQRIFLLEPCPSFILTAMESGTEKEQELFDQSCEVQITPLVTHCIYLSPLE